MRRHEPEPQVPQFVEPARPQPPALPPEEARALLRAVVLIATWPRDVPLPAWARARDWEEAKRCGVLGIIPSREGAR